MDSDIDRGRDSYIDMVSECDRGMDSYRQSW